MHLVNDTKNGGSRRMMRELHCLHLTMLESIKANKPNQNITIVDNKPIPYA